MVLTTGVGKKDRSSEVITNTIFRLKLTFDKDIARQIKPTF